MKAAELSELAKQGKIEDILGQLFSGYPFAFADAPAEYPKFRQKIATALKCPPEDVIIVDPNFFDTAWPRTHPLRCQIAHVRQLLLRSRYATTAPTMYSGDIGDAVLKFLFDEIGSEG